MAPARPKLGAPGPPGRPGPRDVPLGLFAAVRMIRLAPDRRERGPRGRGGALLGALAGRGRPRPRRSWPSGPRAALGLFLLVPLNLLAARAITDLANRRIPIRTLTWLAPATAVSSPGGPAQPPRGGRRPGPRPGRLGHGAGPAPGARPARRRRRDHPAASTAGPAAATTASAGSWAAFLAAVLVVTVAAGIREVWFRHRETDDLLMLRAMILRRDRERPFDLVAVVGPDAAPHPERRRPGGRLRFILRSALPRLPQLDLTTHRRAARPAPRPAPGDPRRHRPAPLLRRPVAARPRGHPPRPLRRPRRLRHRH